MGLARAVAGAVLQDALLPAPGTPGTPGTALRLELPGERLLTAAAAVPPLLLASLAFARHVAAGSPVRCLAPGNFTAQQAAFVDVACWQWLERRGAAGAEWLWFLKVLPYALLAQAALLAAPHALWRRLALPRLRRDLRLVLDELRRSHNRAVRLLQQLHRHDDWDEYERAQEERCFEFPLLERYLARRRRSRALALLYVLRHALLLLLLLASALALALLALTLLQHEDFTCAAVLPVPCRVAGVPALRHAALAAAAAAALAVPVAAWHALRLCRSHAALLGALRLLPALQGLPRGDGVGFSDLAVLLLLLRRNAESLPDYGRLRAACALNGDDGDDGDDGDEGDKPPVRSLVGFMALLAGLEPPPRADYGHGDEPTAKMEIEENGTKEALGSD